MPEKSFNRAARWTGFGLAIVAPILIAVTTNREGYKKREYYEVEEYQKWSEEVVEIAKRIPVQDGGRMKPLETRAGFLMLKLHGARKMKIKSGKEKISIGPTEWLLDVLFRPELAKKMPTFRVDDSDLLKTAGIKVKDRRDRYSFNELNQINNDGKILGLEVLRGSAEDEGSGAESPEASPAGERIEITFESRKGVIYDIYGTGNGSDYSLLTRVEGSDKKDREGDLVNKTKAVVANPAGAGKDIDRSNFEIRYSCLQVLGTMAIEKEEKVGIEKKKNPDYEEPRGEPDPRLLARLILEYRSMLGTHEFAQGVAYPGAESGEPVNGDDPSKVSFWIEQIPRIRERSVPPEMLANLQQIIQEVSVLLRSGEGGLEWLPPYEAEVVLRPGAQVQVFSGERGGMSTKTFKIRCETGAVEVFEGKSKLGTLREGEEESHAGADLVVRNGSGAEATIKVQGREWMSAGNRLTEVANGLDLRHWKQFAGDLKTLETLYTAAKGKESEFADKLDDWRKELTSRASALGEKEGKIESEVTYYKQNYFIRGLVWFILAFIVAATSWLAPASGWGKWTYRITWVLGVLGAFYLVWGIIHRCILMERPPVGNLYDTIPFIAGGGVLVLFLLEAATRRRIALGAAIAVGLLGLFLARAFEGVDAQDHMDPLRAVLRSNFWLSTHVIIITLGYSGGLIAAAMSHVYLYARAFGLDRSDRSLCRFLTRSVYGLVCFTLFFSLVGTVLGGIWANDSWGRFWGWDPKENGAMLIVLWCLIILHARMGGYLREWGLHIASVLGAIVVAFSWWGVNLLGKGLHSYGFTEGIGGAVTMFYSFEALVALGGIVLAVLDKKSRRGKSRGGGAGGEGNSPSYTGTKALEQ